jgi:hypothetical protein
MRGSVPHPLLLLVDQGGKENGFVEILGACEWFRNGLWFASWSNGERLVGLTIKVEPTGYLAILKFITAEGPKVGFYSSKTLEGVFRGLSSDKGREAVRLREDKYALDKITQSR